MKAPLGSLLWRIIGLHFIAVAAISVTLALAVRLLLNSTASGFEHDALKRHEVAIANALHRTPQGWRLDLPPDLRTMYAQGYSGFAFAVLNDRGAVLFSSRPNRAALFPLSVAANATVPYQRSHGPAVYYGDSFAERRGGERVWVQVAQDLQNPDVVIDDIVSAFLRNVAWLILPILVLLAAIDFVIVRRALRPVRDASEMASRIGPSSLSLRLPTGRLPDEIAPLTRAVNEALDRLEQGFRIQREFTADAAHELRTPLSILRMRLNALTDADLRRALAADIDVMARVVGQLLDMADLETFILDPDQITDLNALGGQVVEYMAPLAVAKGRELALNASDGDAWVHGDDQILFQAVRNLVENALAHAPPASTVEVKIGPPGQISVLDHGPGVSEAERELVFRRFWRRNRSRSDGAGLGLSIVRRIVEAHGGDVLVQARAGGGAEFVVRLNPAPAPAAHSTPDLEV